MKDELNPGDQEKESKKEEDISKKEKNSIVLIDAIKNLIANEIFSFASTSLLTIVSILVYRISYLRHCQEEKTLDLQHLYFNSIIFTFSMTAINLFATTIEKKLGLKWSIVVGTLIQIISFLILFFSKNYYLDLLAYFVLGGSVFPLNLMTRNAMFFFFQIRGKLMGASSIVSALRSSGFSILYEKVVINPMSDEADVDDKFYTYDVSKRFLNYILINIIINAVCCIFTAIIIVPYNKEKHGNGLSFGGDTPSINPAEENENEKKGEEENQSDDSQKEEKKKSFKKTFMKNAIKSKRVINLAIISVLSSQLAGFFGEQWRNIAIRNNIPTSYQQNTLAIIPFVTCFSQLVFSWLSDSIPFRYLYSVLSLIQAFNSIIFCFTFQSPFLFSLVVLFHFLINGGVLAITSPHYMKVFGLNKYIEAGTMIGIPTILLTPLNKVLMFLFDTYLIGNNTQNLFGRYFILYLILGALKGIAGVLSCFESEEPFVIE
jgi:hypothetical protein